MAEGQCFQTHRNILASVSDYFRVMLTGQMIEARQDHVELKGVSANAVKTLLNFAYTGRLCLNMDDVLEVLSGASHLQMQGAVELCSEFLMTEISCKTCVDILNLAEMYTLSQVRQSGIQYVVSHFDKLIDTEQFYRLHKNHLAIILQSNKLCVASELHLFNIVRRWVDYDSGERMKCVFPLLQNIRFALMSAEDIVDQVASSSLISADERCHTLVDEALRYHVLPTRQPLLQSPRTHVRNEPCMIALGGRYGINIGYKYNSNKMYALGRDKWYAVSTPDANFLYAAVCVLDNFLYVCGGMGVPAHAHAVCYRYDPRYNTWTRIARMKTPRQSFPLVGFSHKLYAFGGGTPVHSGIEHPPTDAVEKYSVDGNTWTSITPLPGKRKSSSACEFDGKIYVSGGRTGDETMSTFWCYDPGSDTWSDKQCMIIPHAGHAMVTINNRIYVIDRVNLSVEVYSPSVDEWMKVNPPYHVHAGIARPAVMGPWVHFISYMTEDADNLCKRYNVLTQQTEDLPRFPDNVHCVIGATLTLPQSVFSDANNNST